jgi:hypothetical protein
MFAVLLLITNYLITAILSIFIGLAIHFGQSWAISDKKNRYNGLFYILILITCVNMILLILKRFYEK